MASVDQEPLYEVRCARCGHYLGRALVTDGEAFFWCGRKGCKLHTAVLGEEQRERLTTPAATSRLRSSKAT